MCGPHSISFKILKGFPRKKEFPQACTMETLPTAEFGLKWKHQLLAEYPAYCWPVVCISYLPAPIRTYVNSLK